MNADISSEQGCPGLVKALEDAKIILPFPDYSGLVVWYGDSNVHIINPMGCIVGTHNIQTDFEPEVRQRMETFIERVRERIQNKDESPTIE